MKRKVEKKIKEIHKALDVNKANLNNLGLLNGFCGTKLFEINYITYKNQNTKFDSHFNEICSNIDPFIKKWGFDPYFSSGVSGIFWFFAFMRRNKLIKFNPKVFFSEIEPFLDTAILLDSQEKNYDLFRGVLGIILLYEELGILNRKIDLQKQLINNLKMQAITSEKNESRWHFFSFNVEKERYEMHDSYVNLGLAHGLPGLVSCLSRLHHSLNSQTFPLVDNAINYILKYESSNYFDDTLSMFPATFNQDKEITRKDFKSRLAWCYGDLGIACMFLTAGNKFGKKEWIEKANEIIIRSTKRRDLMENLVFDAGLCHGTSGIAHIFNRFSYLFGNKEVRNATDFWIEQTLEMAKFNEGLAGYKFGPTVKPQDYGVLEGVSGIGLSLISYLNNKQMGWDRCLQVT